MHPSSTAIVKQPSGNNVYQPAVPTSEKHPWILISSQTPTTDLSKSFRSSDSTSELLQEIGRPHRSPFPTYFDKACQCDQSDGHIGKPCQNSYGNNVKVYVDQSSQYDTNDFRVMKSQSLLHDILSTYILKECYPAVGRGYCNQYTPLSESILNIITKCEVNNNAATHALSMKQCFMFFTSYGPKQ